MSDTESVSSQGEALLRGSAPSANMFEETVERLGHSIKLGLIKPGQQLPPERELAELIGVSRVTVRSALQVLVQGGFLIAKRGRNGGTFVVDHPPVWNGTNSERPNSHVSASDAAAFSDRRRVIETGVCELAAERIDEVQVAALRERLLRLSEFVGDRDSYRAEDAQFHIAIAEATGDSHLVRMVAEIQAELGSLISHVPPSEAALIHSNLQHTKIVEALASHDSSAAREMMLEHVSGTGRFLHGLLPMPSTQDR